jgi:hypothetical protein
LVGPDPLDCLAPPALSNRVPKIWVDHRSWNKRPGLYAVDIRPLGSYPAKFGLTMSVPRNPKVTKYVLSWSGLNSIPTGLKATLVDRVKGRSLNMRQVSAYEIAVPPNKGSYGLQVVIQ